MSEHIFMTEVVQPALVKDGDLFLVCRADGGIIARCGSGLGLFHRDTRYLARYEIALGGAPPLSLMASSARGALSVHELTNDAARQSDGSAMPMQSLGVRLERSVDGPSRTLRDVFTIRNFTPKPVRFELRLTIDARFEDIFELRGARAKRRGPSRRVTIGPRGPRFDYRGADAIRRRLDVACSRDVEVGRAGGARTILVGFDLASEASEVFTVDFAVSEQPAATVAAAPRPAFFDGVRIESDGGILNAAADRSFADLGMLRTGLAHNFIAGGMPWFVSPFGRDSLLAALQTLVYDPRPAEGTARLFALHQGRRYDAVTGEQPGKIHHELRLGAMARLAETPHRPSFTSLDSTPLFLILIGRHAQWTGRRDLFRELRPSVDAALKWIDGDGDSDGDGFLDYGGETADGLVNQGWKDSNCGVPRRDGGKPEPPIALCEVQGYVYLAKRLMAEAFRAEGDGARADRLDTEAAALRDRFNRAFWMADEDCYALALEGGGRPVAVVASNAGQVLWSGIAEPDKAARTARRLAAPDMDSGWGIRTLSERALAYNPLNYHLGCVWPFDNALIVEGLRNHGLESSAMRLADAVIDAAGCFSLGRLPEFYVGFGREAGLFPARCPFAEPLQAWSAGAIPQIIASLLGLARVGDELRFDRPLLPSKIDRLAVRGLTFGDRRLDLRFERSRGGAVIGRAEEAEVVR